MINKTYSNICRNKLFWQLLIQRDFNNLSKDYSRSSYDTLYQFFNEETLNVIGELLTEDIKIYPNLQNMYNEIFAIIVNYVRDIRSYEDEFDINSNNLNRQSMLNYINFVNQLKGEVTNNIFDVFLLKPNIRTRKKPVFTSNILPGLYDRYQSI